MKNINNYIQEKLVIDKDVKVTQQQKSKRTHQPNDLIYVIDTDICETGSRFAPGWIKTTTSWKAALKYSGNKDYYILMLERKDKQAAWKLIKSNKWDDANKISKATIQKYPNRFGKDL